MAERLISAPTTPHNPTVEEDYTSDLVKETVAAKILSITVAKLQRDRWLNQGIPYVRIGKCIRYSRSAIGRYIEENTTRP